MWPPVKEDFSEGCAGSPLPGRGSTALPHVHVQMLLHHILWPCLHQWLRASHESQVWWWLWEEPELCETGQRYVHLLQYWAKRNTFTKQHKVQNIVPNVISATDNGAERSKRTCECTSSYRRFLGLRRRSHKTKCGKHSPWQIYLWRTWHQLQVLGVTYSNLQFLSISDHFLFPCLFLSN